MKRNLFGLPALALAVAAGTAAPAFAGGVLPTLTKSFSPIAITDGGTTTLTFTVTNPAGAPALSTVGWGDTLPVGLVVGPGSVGGTCANAAAATTATAGTHLIMVSNLQVLAGSSTCTVTVAVTNAPGPLNPDCTGNPAAFTNTAAGVTVTNAINGVAPSCLVVLGVTPGTPTATPTNTPTTVPPTSTPTNTPTTVPPTATATVVSGGGPPLGSIPTLSAGMLALLAVGLAGGALFLVRRS